MPDGCYTIDDALALNSTNDYSAVYTSCSECEVAPSPSSSPDGLTPSKTPTATPSSSPVSPSPSATPSVTPSISPPASSPAASSPSVTPSTSPPAVDPSPSATLSVTSSSSGNPCSGLTAHFLDYDASSCESACGNSVSIYSDTGNLCTATTLRRATDCTRGALAGHYNSGSDTRYWNGSAFTTSCSTCNCP